MTESEDVSAVRTVNRISAVLHCFSPAEPVLTMTDISKKLKLPLSTIHRLISALEKERFLAKSPDGRGYQYGIQLLEWGALAQYNFNFRNEAKPFLHALQEATNENTVLFVRDGAYGVGIEAVESSQPLRVTTPIGERIPLYASAIVLILLAYLPETEVNEIIKEIEFVKYTPTTISSLPELQRYLTTFREQGYGVSFDWFTYGSVGVAAPVFNYTNKVVASLSVIAPTAHVNDENLGLFIDKVKTTAHELSIHLGYHLR
jgi:DNA-binding IclR family transcriptional regulator